MMEEMSVLAPRSELERRILGDARWQTGAAWGSPRSGHPEGAVVRHIIQVLRNIDRIEHSGPNRDQLRLIALVHDTLKYQVDRSRPRIGTNDHARLARAFARQYITDAQVLLVVETHDDAYRAWLADRRGDEAAARARAEALIQRLTNSGALALYLAFYRADNEVPGKTSEHREWLAGLCPGCS